MYRSMKILINRHFYKTREEAQERLDMFYAKKRLIEDQYSELCDLLDEKYPENIIN
nr:MAG TPA: hypothetical protein [Caudoviricetes sp.]